jgi:DNA-binding winged helix-turn-helix (wHTH) protein
MQANQILSFGAYRLDPYTGQLWRGKQEVRLTGKAAAVLLHLIEHAGQVVSKKDLFASVWPDAVVSDAALTSCIQEVRQALHDDARKPRYIETMHRRGFRFLPAITTQPVSGSRFQVPSAQAKERGFRLGTLNLEHGTPLVGRAADLTFLHERLATALRGQRQVVFVTGEPGIGKTSLVGAFLAGIGQRGTGNGEQRRQKAKSKKQK